MSIIKSSQDFSRRPRRVAAGIIWLFAILAIGQSIVASFFLALFGGLVLAYDQGIEVDTDARRIRQYNSFLFLWKFGTWESLAGFQSILLLKKKGTRGILSPSLAQKVDIQDVEHDVYLARQNHRKRVLIKSFDSQSEAKTFAESLSAETGINIEHYSPPISKRTRARRR